jgi:hypothetical protein
VEDMAMKAANGEGDGQLAVTEEELRELNYHVSIYKPDSTNKLHPKTGPV